MQTHTAPGRPAAVHRPPSSHWMVLLDPARPGWANMARDAALLELAADLGLSAFRLYSWAPHCLSFGRHEPARRRYDRDRIDQLGLDCVRRPTGGRAVWHARELTYAVAAPLHVFGGLREAYRAIHGLLAEALRRLGAEPLLATASPVPPPHAGPCFAAPVGGEVLLRGRKVIGSAQVRRGDAFLQHGSMLLEDPQDLVAGLSGVVTPARPDITLAEALGRPVGFAEAAAAVGEAWAGRFGGDPAGDRAPAALDAVEAREAGRFRDPAWTWMR